MTQSGMVAAAHLLGVGGLRNFIEAGGVGGGSDAYGTQITEYIKTFAGYDLGLGRTTSWAHDNRFAGASGRDVFKGHGGNDVLIGAGGGDRLFGQSGADDLRGGGGRDWLFGGRGDDLLKGGSGRDVFVFSPNAGHDNVADFADGVDRIDLRRFHFADAAEALSHFFESGSASDGIAGFSLGDVSVTIHGVDRAGLDASDLIV
ncbi:MAG: hypothetical protein H6873_01060 [Hyphomicrobiaceae bacterium]|nr:hypothetical protein [Hyphomicrobiaceae bacterium]